MRVLLVGVQIGTIMPQWYLSILKVFKICIAFGPGIPLRNSSSVNNKVHWGLTIKIFICTLFLTLKKKQILPSNKKRPFIQVNHLFKQCKALQPLTPYRAAVTDRAISSSSTESINNVSHIFYVMISYFFQMFSTYAYTDILCICKQIYH